MRVLVVEDDRRIARRLTSVLQDAGYAVYCVGNGEQAWFRGDTEDHDAVILDLGLPRMDGLTVLKKWREAGRDVPVLILSARGLGPNASPESTRRRRLSRHALRHGGTARPLASASASKRWIREMPARCGSRSSPRALSE